MKFTIEVQNENEASRFINAVVDIIGIDTIREQIMKALKSVITIKNPTQLSLQEIANIYCEGRDLKFSVLIKHDRRRDIVDHRHILCYIMYKKFRHPQWEIGTFMNRDHSSIGNGIKKIVGYIQFDKNWKERIENALKLY